MTITVGRFNSPSHYGEDADAGPNANKQFSYPKANPYWLLTDMGCWP